MKEQEEQEEEQQMPMGSPFVNPYHQYNSSIETLTNPETDLHKMELALRNMIKRDGGIIKVGDPLLNDEGINSVLSQVQSLSNQVSVMSNFDKHQIQAIMVNFVNTLAIDLMLNRQKYEVENPSARTKISTIAGNYAYVTLLRAKDEGEKRFWKGSQQDIRHEVVQQVGQQKKGMMNKMFNWGGT